MTTRDNDGAIKDFIHQTSKMHGRTVIIVLPNVMNTYLTGENIFT